MKLGEVQKLYYLLHAVQFRYDEHIDFELVIDYNGKLITADFLNFRNISKTTVSEKMFDSDLDIQDTPLESAFFDEILATWNLNYAPYGSKPTKAFSEPGVFLSYVMKACEEMNQAPFITNRVYNLRYLESGISFDEAILMETDYSVVALVPKQFI